MEVKAKECATRLDFAGLAEIFDSCPVLRGASASSLLSVVAFNHPLDVAKAKIMIEFLLKNGADINTKGLLGNSPLDEAYNVLIMRGDPSDCEFTRYLRALGGKEAKRQMTALR